MSYRVLADYAAMVYGKMPCDVKKPCSDCPNRRICDMAADLYHELSKLAREEEGHYIPFEKARLMSL